MRSTLTMALIAAIPVSGCGGGPSHEEAQAEAENIMADLLDRPMGEITWEEIAEAAQKVENLKADREVEALRAFAGEKVAVAMKLHDELIAAQRATHDDYPDWWPSRNVETAERRKQQDLENVGRLLGSESLADLDRVIAWAEVTSPFLENALGRVRSSQTNFAAEAATEAQRRALAEAAARRDVNAVRDSAIAELAELENLHNELIGVLETIVEAHTDEWEKRWAGDKVTSAKMGKEGYFDWNLRRPLASATTLTALDAVRSHLANPLASGRASVEARIARARETLKLLRGG